METSRKYYYWYTDMLSSYLYWRYTEYSSSVNEFGQFQYQGFYLETIVLL
jgi:hypothetical protein